MADWLTEDDLRQMADKYDIDGNQLLEVDEFTELFREVFLVTV